jgi:hypothetical protein
MIPTRLKLLTAGAAFFVMLGVISPQEARADVAVQSTPQPSSPPAIPAPAQTMSPTDQVHVVQNGLQQSGLERTPASSGGIQAGQFSNQPYANLQKPQQQQVIYQLAKPDQDTQLYGIAPPPREFNNIPRQDPDVCVCAY